MSDCFSGEERLEVLPALNRVMRMGAPDELKVSDRVRIAGALRRRDFETARRYIDLFHRESITMVAILIEWTLEMPSTLSKLVDAETERSVTQSAYERTMRAFEPMPTQSEQRRAIDMTLGLLHPDHLEVGSADEHRAKVSAGQSPIQPVLTEMNVLYEELCAAFTSEDESLIRDSFERRWFFALGAHDAGVQFAQCFPAAVQSRVDQRTAERVVSASFASCSFFEGLWSLGELPPGELAAFLAEHLRFHFSGADRAGSTEIIEDDEKYRLVFDPCGSGGAMRRRLAARGRTIEVLQAPSAMSWNRANQVPYYCSHCANNELTSIARFGYPVFVTEFDPDPQRPCGWTVYKDPAKIPDEYFTRLGTEKAATDSR
jgi:hypothetical protein